MQSSLLSPLTPVLRRTFIRRLQGRFITVPYKNLSAFGFSLCRTLSATTIPLHRLTCLLQPTLPTGIQLIVILIDNKTFVKPRIFIFIQNRYVLRFRTQIPQLHTAAVRTQRKTAFRRTPASPLCIQPHAPCPFRRISRRHC